MKPINKKSLLYILKTEKTIMKQLLIRLPEALKTQLTQTAKDEGRSITKTVEQAVKMYLKHR